MADIVVYYSKCGHSCCIVLATIYTIYYDIYHAYLYLNYRSRIIIISIYSGSIIIIYNDMININNISYHTTIYDYY